MSYAAFHCLEVRMESSEGLEPIGLCPINYFLIEVDCLYLSDPEEVKFKKFQLPALSELNCEDPFGDVHVGWNEEGIAFYAKVNQPLQESVFPNQEKGDSLELMIDTRDIKTARFNHRFCHHFVCLAEPVGGVQASEVTHFRTEDTHPLCDPKELKVRTYVKKKSYEMFLWLPAKSLHGYDPNQCDRLGFTYRLNRYKDEPQHFSVHSAEYQIDQNPSLWSRLTLTS